jgi:hypothetical protein
MVLVLDVGLKKTAMGGRGQEFLIDRLGDILILVDGTHNEFNLEHVAFMFISDPLNLAR